MLNKIIIAVVATVLIGFGYYTISPTFKTVTLNEEAPVMLSVSSSKDEVMIVESYPVMGTVGHPAEGTVRLIDSPEGKTIRYENFKTINGPDLFVYLSKDLEGKEFVSLGELRGTEGNINYIIPAEVDISDYKYVMTWCKQFGVLFNYADISINGLTSNELSVEDSMQDSDDMSKSAGIPIPSTTTGQQNYEMSKKTALLANGCFWCVEHDLEEVTGVIDVVSGYAGGSTENPTYKNYEEGGHREVVLVTYDANTITFGNLVEHIIKHGDPTDAEGSFGDRGKEYAPAIFYENDIEKIEARRIIDTVDALRTFPNPLPLLVIPRVPFWAAEEYHQDYSEKNPVRYNLYRTASGRDTFIKKYWGDSANTFVTPSIRTEPGSSTITSKENSWQSFMKPSPEVLRARLTSIQYEVTQEDGTETPFKNEYDKNDVEGIYVDIVSGEPLYFSKDKYDSGTGWPSFVKPITDDAVVLHKDSTLFTKRTEVRSRFADSHLGHVFDDGPADRGGKRYCMNSASLRFISQSNMEKEGYAYLFPLMNS